MAEERGRVHVVLGRVQDLDQYERDVQAGLTPRNVMYEVIDAVDGVLHFTPDRGGLQGRVDQLCSKLLAQPGEWAEARRMARTLAPGDTVLCSDHIAFVLVALLALRRKRVRIVMSVMMPSRPRIKAGISRRFIRDRIWLFFVNSPHKVDYLEELGVDRSKVLIPPDVVDDRFFAPLAPEEEPAERWIASSGREQRDYVTLAEAFEVTEVPVRVCATSGNPSAKQKIRMPEALPPGVEMRHFPWPEYRELMRGAAVVVIPLIDHDYSAGLTALYEAYACRRPTVATATVGRMVDLVSRGLTVGVPVGDPIALRTAVDDLLADPERSAAMAERGYEFFHQTATHAIFVDWMASVLLGRHDQV